MEEESKIPSRPEPWHLAWRHLNKPRGICWVFDMDFLISLYTDTASTKFSYWEAQTVLN